MRIVQAPTRAVSAGRRLVRPARAHSRRGNDASSRRCSIDVPTREEMREIESSNRLYEENGVLYMTATIVTKLDTDLPQSTQVTFILAGTKLVTNRYTDPLPFRRFITYAETHPAACSSSAIAARGAARSPSSIGSPTSSSAWPRISIRFPPRCSRRPVAGGAWRRHSDFRAGAGPRRPKRRARLEGAREPGESRAPARVRSAGREFAGDAGSARSASARCRATCSR